MNKELIAVLVWGGVGVAAAFLGALAYSFGHIDSVTFQRVVFGANGLLMAWYGNRMPKVMVPRTRPATRVAGWSLVFVGLAQAMLWMFAPVPVAIIGGTCAVAMGVAMTLAYCFSFRENNALS